MDKLRIMFRKTIRIEVLMVLCLIIGSFLNTFFAMPFNLSGKEI